MIAIKTSDKPYWAWKSAKTNNVNAMNIEVFLNPKYISCIYNSKNTAANKSLFLGYRLGSFFANWLRFRWGNARDMATRIMATKGQLPVAIPTKSMTKAAIAPTF